MASQRWMRHPIRHGDISPGGLHQHGTRHRRERRQADADCRNENTMADVFTPADHPQRAGLQCQQMRIGQTIDFALFLDAFVGHAAVSQVHGNVPRHYLAHHCLFVFLGRSVLFARSNIESWKLVCFLVLFRN
jgi:hypothetical protein